MLTTLLAIFLGCSHCPSGYATDASGACVSGDTDETAALDGDGQLLWSEIAASIPACTPDDADDALNLVGGCVDGACVGMTKAEVDDVLGAPTECDDSLDDCVYAGGIELDYDAGIADTFSLSSPYGGRDQNGLGVGVGLGCFVDVFGTPDAMAAFLENGVVGIWNLAWYDANVSIYDEDSFGADVGDWVIDTIYVGDST